jgi:hypothetical protein
MLHERRRKVKRIIEIEIGCCGDCPYYNWKKHNCGKGAKEEGKPTDNFYVNCPLNYREEEKNDAD